MPKNKQHLRKYKTSEMVKLSWEQCLSVNEIAEHYNTRPDNIAHKFNKHDVPRRHKYSMKLRQHEMIEAYMLLKAYWIDLKCMGDIAKDMGMSERVVAKLFRTYSIPRRDRADSSRIRYAKSVGKKERLIQKSWENAIDKDLSIKWKDL
jgi:AraC-like DNA-binding protein